MTLSTMTQSSSSYSQSRSTPMVYITAGVAVCLLNWASGATAYDIHGNINEHLHIDDSQAYWAGQIQQLDVPVMKMLKRQVRHFGGAAAGGPSTAAPGGPVGGTGSLSVTVVFQSARPANVRWLRLDAESPNAGTMVPVAGDVGYEVSQLSSGSVTASTLTVLRRNSAVSDRSPPVPPLVFQTVITTEDATVQYQLRSRIHAQRRGIYVDDIDGAVWLRVPPSRVEYVPGSGRLTIECAAIMPSETTGFSNELVLSRATSSLDAPTNTHFGKIVNIHRDTQNLTEEQVNTLLVGRRQLTSSGHVLYHVGVSSRNATARFAGHYQCIVERENDRLFAVSSVAVEGRNPPLPKTPQIELQSCSHGTFDRGSNELRVRLGRTSCIQCRALADPRPDVVIYHGVPGGSGSHELGALGGPGQRAFTRPGVGVERYVDVAAGGVAVVAYTLPGTGGSGPGAEDGGWPATEEVPRLQPGVYHCAANNSETTRRLRFTVRLE